MRVRPQLHDCMRCSVSVVFWTSSDYRRNKSYAFISCGCICMLAGLQYILHWLSSSLFIAQHNCFVFSLGGFVFFLLLQMSALFVHCDKFDFNLLWIIYYCNFYHTTTKTKCWCNFSRSKKRQTDKDNFFKWG